MHRLRCVHLQLGPRPCVLSSGTWLLAHLKGCPLIMFVLRCKCPSATYSGSNGTVDCLSCPSGRFALLPGQTACESMKPARPAGVTQVSSDCLSCFCSMCPRHLFFGSSVVVSRVSTTVCQRSARRLTCLGFDCGRCTSNTFQPRSGAASCIPCPAGSTASEQQRRVLCACGVGFYATSGDGALVFIAVENGSCFLHPTLVCRTDDV
jgi:hypothetical protein